MIADALSRFYDEPLAQKQQDITEPILFNEQAHECLEALRECTIEDELWQWN